MTASVHLFLLLVASFGGGAAHPCDVEVSTACPDRPPAELGSCLKSPSEHEAPTTLSSECTDFIALNSACSEEVSKFCDGSYFTDDTILCLKTWVEPESLSSKCTNVMKWAIPQPEEGEEKEEVTDELGLSEKDYEEKKEWQRKRKAVREEAIGRMKMKEEDRKKEEDRVALEKFKEEDPEGYRQMMEQEAETKRQAAEMARRERQRQAALERKKQIERGEDPDADGSPKGTTTAKSAKTQAKSSSLSGFLCFLAVAGVFVLFFYIAKKLGVVKTSSGGKLSNKGSKKRR